MVTAGCGSRWLYPTVRATPTVVIAETDSAMAGRAVTMRYSWQVDPQFKAPAQPYRVFVHFLGEDDKLAFTDDHETPIAMSQWQPGARYEYVRTVVLPDRAQTFKIRAGLFSAAFPYKATVSDGQGGEDFPTVTTIHVRGNDTLAEESVAGGEGFDRWEIDGRATSRQSRWVGRRGKFLFLQRPEGSTLLLQGFTMRSRLPGQAKITVRVGSLEVTQGLANDDRLVLQLDVPGDGTTKLVEGQIEADQSFLDRGREVAFCVERFRSIPRKKDQAPE
jgi:hypothetical protein